MFPSKSEPSIVQYFNYHMFNLAADLGLDRIKHLDLLHESVEAVLGTHDFMVYHNT